MRIFLFFGLLFSFNAFAFSPFTPMVGVTTKLDETNCVAIDGDAFDQTPEIDYFSEECVGLGGWRVQPNGGDARSFLKLVNGRQTLDLTDAMQEVGQFPNITDKIEWRVARVRGQSITPIALLTEITGQSPDDINKVIGSVLIVKLGSNKSCVLSKVNFDAKNEQSRTEAWKKARTEADTKATNSPCR